MLRTHTIGLALLLSLVARPAAGAQTLMLASGGSVPATIPNALRDLQDSLVVEAEAAWHAHPARLLPGWAQAVRAVERRVGQRWQGLPAIVLLVPDDGRGFPCDDARCLGRYLGARIEVAGGDTTTMITSSIILLAESMVMRHDVWEHELTHALLAQYGLVDESTRHDRRYFRDEHLLTH